LVAEDNWDQLRDGYDVFEENDRPLVPVDNRVEETVFASVLDEGGEDDVGTFAGSADAPWDVAEPAELAEGLEGVVNPRVGDNLTVVEEGEGDHLV